MDSSRKLFLLTLFLSFLPLQLLWADSLTDKKRLQTAFIYQFSNYIDWPTDEDSLDQPFIVAVWQGSPLEESLRGLAKERKIKSRSIEIKIINNLQQAQDSQICILIDGASVPIGSLSSFKFNHSVIITEKEDALNKGSMINFLLEKDKLRFEINRSLMENKGFQVNSKLLRLAKDIR